MNIVADLRKRKRMVVFPKPDRSNLSPRLDPEDETGEMDIGWTEGKFSDGHPFRAELWSWQHLTAVTFFFSRIGLENKMVDDLVELLERELSLRFIGSRSVTADKIQDYSGNEIWSVCIIIRHEKETWAVMDLQLNPYQEPHLTQSNEGSSVLLPLRPWGLEQ
jgi:hypothetical protein